MNILALIAAIVGVVLMSLTVYFGNKIANKWKRYLAAGIGLIVSLVIMSSIPSLFGDDSTETAGQAGGYLVPLIIIAIIIKSIFFRKKKAES